MLPQKSQKNSQIKHTLHQSHKRPRCRWSPANRVATSFQYRWRHWRRSSSVENFCLFWGKNIDKLELFFSKVNEISEVSKSLCALPNKAFISKNRRSWLRKRPAEKRIQRFAWALIPFCKGFRPMAKLQPGLWTTLGQVAAQYSGRTPHQRSVNEPPEYWAEEFRDFSTGGWVIGA